MPSWRTKAAAEEAFLEANPKATIIRPSIVFGPGDSFFNVRFSLLLRPTLRPALLDLGELSSLSTCFRRRRGAIPVCKV